MIRLLIYKLLFFESELSILNIGGVDNCIAFAPRSKYNLGGGKNNG